MGPLLNSRDTQRTKTIEKAELPVVVCICIVLLSLSPQRLPAIIIAVCAYAALLRFVEGASLAKPKHNMPPSRLPAGNTPATHRNAGHGTLKVHTEKRAPSVSSRCTVVAIRAIDIPPVVAECDNHTKIVSHMDDKDKFVNLVKGLHASVVGEPVQVAKQGQKLFDVPFPFVKENGKASAAVSTEPFPAFNFGTMA